MGRGRAKAKQTKVARELKYGGPQTDFDRLQAELGSGGGSSTAAHTARSRGSGAAPLSRGAFHEQQLDRKWDRIFGCGRG